MGWKELAIILGVFAAWLVLIRWVLPWCGIETCCSACSSKQCSVGTPPAGGSVNADGMNTPPEQKPEDLP